ncbi:integrin alpha-11-like isoform X1 [Acipenser oxyrinchus oxyrinchus]|uniref:Integrin alpha-11-like isoform X1 n=1 Tax=Acipenser oxyrinchus oxyrinchus TaxID=40147 RepID=A0AAD8CVV2_ACIOX|nr:integrin alpha-11-like isoform X1 [Acipenser oxyrinchus oxyrinchus]
MEYYTGIIVVWACTLLPGGSDSFNIDTKEPRIIQGSKEAQFGYTVQQHEAGGQKWLLVGAPFETNGQQQTGDIYRCLMNNKRNSTCSKLNLGRISLTNVAERKNKMRLGMTLTTNPKDNSFVTCGPLWSHECGSSYYSTGICSRVNSTFKFSRSIAPAFQRCETYMDIVIVLDGSNSIYPWYEVQNFLINILQKFYIGPGQIQVGVVQYGEDVVHEFQLNDYRTVEEVVNAARNIEQRGGAETRTAFGIEIARSEAFKRGGRRGSKKVMIVITDGESHDSPDLEKVIKDSEKDNITRYAIAVLGYYNRRGINPKAFLKEIKHIASDPDDKHFFNVADESALKDIVDALGERIFSLEGTNKNETSFGLEMSQAGFSSHIVEDGILVGAVGAYDWNGAVLMETGHGRVIPPKEAYLQEFPEELKNHGAYLGYTVTSLVSAKAGRLYVAGAPRFNHTGKVIIFTLKNNGNLTILHSLKGQQIGSYYGSEIGSVDTDGDGITDALLVGAPMYFSQGWEKGKIYIYRVTEQNRFVLDGSLEVGDGAQNARFGSSISPVPDLNYDTYNDVVVGAPLEDEHRGAIYIFHGYRDRILRKHKQRIGAADLPSGLMYFGRSIHGKMDLNQDGLVDLAVGSLGAAVLLWSRSIVQIHATIKFEPAKVNIFNKDCKRNGKDATCMAAIACLNVTTKTPHFLTQEVALNYTAFIDERRYAARAILDETSDKILHKNITVFSGAELCDHIYFHVFETADYMRPVVFTLEYGMLYPDDGPVLDAGWPTVVKSSLSFWNGCDEDERCIPDLTIHSISDIPDLREFCRMLLQAAESLCGHHAMVLGSGHVIQSGRRRLAVDVVLKNRGENAYSTQLNITYSHNLHFASLTIKDNSDIKIECGNEDNVNHNKVCNVSLPFFRAKAEVAFHLDFEFSRSVFLDHVQIALSANSDGEEDEMTIHDNSNVIFHQLKYEAELLFTRYSSLTHYEIKASDSLEKYHSVSPPFNFTFQIQNLGFFPVQNLLLNIEIPEVTKSGNRLLELTDFYIDQKEGTFCTAPNTVAHKRTYSEDLSHYPQLNHSNAVVIPVNCSVNLQPYKQLNVHISGVLRTDSLKTVKFKSLALVTTASIAMEASSPMFLREEKSVRHIILEITKEDDYVIPVWIIIGSTLGGLLLLALLILALWKLGFFQSARHKRKEEGGHEPNGKALEER